jgi:hypothetical protein
MLTCPRCGTANLKEGRSFSMHLARFCRGPTLLCHAQPGLFQLKRSYDEMHSQSACTTFQQQMRAFNSTTSDVSLPTRNPLHSIPSLNHQSSTQSQLDHTNVNYNNFDNEYIAQESIEDEPSTIGGHANQDFIMEQCTFQRNTVRLPPDIAFQVHLMSQLNDHRGNDLNMFNEIT